jgi:hypothetical protein
VLRNNQYSHIQDCNPYGRKCLTGSFENSDGNSVSTMRPIDIVRQEFYGFAAKYCCGG